MSVHRPRHIAVPLVGAVAVAVLASGCTPPSSDGGTVVTTDERIPEIRAARAALAKPVPTVEAEAERLVEALEEVWTHQAPADERADRARLLRLEPFRAAVDELDAVELQGTGPDVTAAMEITDAMVAAGRALLEVVEEELASLTAVGPVDQELEQLRARWDQRGSYSEQLEAFEQLALDAEALAEDVAGRVAVPACVELWPRREEAAEVVAERTRQLRELIRDRRGEEFDELRDGYGQDPYGFGAMLGVLDARAAAACWADASRVPPALASLREHTPELAEALDPPDL